MERLQEKSEGEKRKHYKIGNEKYLREDLVNNQILK